MSHITVWYWYYATLFCYDDGNNQYSRVVMINKTQIEKALSTFIDPYLAVDWVRAKAIKKIDIDAAQTHIVVRLGYPCQQMQQALSQHALAHLQQALPEETFTLDIQQQIQRYRIRNNVKGHPNIKNIIAVASGKGGVGKSTVSVNLALALQHQGAQVGILDADIYGPSQPQMLGSYDTPKLQDKKLQPLILHGLQAMSIGNLVELDQALIWRGPMVSQALQQLMRDTQWCDLDYLIVDLPPGTGDIQLTLSQKIPVTAAVIVTTPQDLSLIDAKRAIAMFNKVKIPVLGVIENMSTFVCRQCGHVEPIFGSGGGASIAAQFDTALLGELPLDIQIRQDTDAGHPTVAGAPDGALSQLFIEMARKVAAKLALFDKDYSLTFPEIKVEFS